MKIYPIAIIFFVVCIASCTNRQNKERLNDEEYSSYLDQGKEISAKAQAALLTNVSSAMKEGGSIYAIEFCNLNAASIIDSINSECDCNVLRVSARNRNPINRLSSGDETQVWEYYASKDKSASLHDTVVVFKDQVIYYKPILIGMPTCLKCHGQTNDIDSATYQKINKLYPQDKAVGYELNDLRGLWKIVYLNQNS